MRIKAIALVIALGIALAGPFTGFAQKAKTRAKAPARFVAKKPVAKTPAAKKKVAATKRKVVARKTTARSRRTVAKRTPAPVNQRVPTKDRYAEIQTALADAGYFTGEADGVWNQDSVEALKSFQDANGFEPTGKIDSRSLIKLGLGPNYENSANQSPHSGDAREPG